MDAEMSKGMVVKVGEVSEGQEFDCAVCDDGTPAVFFVVDAEVDACGACESHLGVVVAAELEVMASV
jgi:hypothetical protein